MAQFAKCLKRPSVYGHGLVSIACSVTPITPVIWSLSRYITHKLKQPVHEIVQNTSIKTSVSPNPNQSEYGRKGRERVLSNQNMLLSIHKKSEL